MKRGGHIARYTPLTSNVPLPRSGIGRNAGPKLAPVRQRHTGPSRSVRQLIEARSEGLCEFWQCLDEAAQGHHRLPRRMGGSKAPGINEASNLIRVCLDHHSWAESHRAKALELGLILHAGADPSASPVYLRYGLVLLADDGTWTTYTIPAEEANPHD